MTLKSLNRIFVLSVSSILVLQQAEAADYLAEGREAFLNYDFELASELYAKYAKSLKSKPDADGEILLDKYEKQLDIAESSLDNVQIIEIIDRLDVPANDFLSNIYLPSDEGILLPKEAVPFKQRSNDSDFVFNSASGDFMMWTELDESGVPHFFESTRLIDGSWELPVSAGDILNSNGNVRNPFMLTDGVTLYFASDGDDSMGGYDLFVATKDSATGKYRQPTGVGYPFNSPSNEYMMAIDEENGIGWWVTDRNQIEGKVSVYMFYTNDVRKNYVPDEEDDMVSLAKVEDIALTQKPDKDYRQVVAEIKERAENMKSEKDTGIRFLMPGGKIVRNISDLHSVSAKRNLTQYLDAESEFKSNCSRLSELRRKYHDSGRTASQALKNQILDLEKNIDIQREKLIKMRNSVISAEKNKE